MAFFSLCNEIRERFNHEKADQKLLALNLSRLAQPSITPETKADSTDEISSIYGGQVALPRSPLADEILEIKPAIPDGIPTGIPNTIPDAVPNPSTTRQRKDVPQETFTYLDATHTGAEKAVYSIMYRECITKGMEERHFGLAELMNKTGIRSRNTVHKTIYGLLEKLSIEVVSEARGNPLGPRYRVFKAQEVEQRRKASGIKIDSQTKRSVERGGIPIGIPTSTPSAIANDWDSGIPENWYPKYPPKWDTYK